MATHKAYRLHAYGGPENIKLDEVPVPEPSKTQVLVAVTAVGMNPFDWKIREGYIKDNLPLQLPTILGVDFVGKVSRNGDKASKFQVGDRIMAISNTLRAHAEHIVAEEATLARIPAELSDIDAATLPMPALTAWGSLHAAGEVGPKTKILINGASGICGAFAVQFAKAAGATVIGTASRKNGDYVLSLGADEFIDYQKERFEDKVSDIDLILDYHLLGDQESNKRAWKVLKTNGAIVSVADPTVMANAPEGYRGFFLQTKPDVAALEGIAQQLVEGKITSKVARVFERDELVKAMEINKAGGTTGRLVVDFTTA